MKKDRDLSSLEVCAELRVEVIEVLRFYHVEDPDEESDFCSFL